MKVPSQASSTLSTKPLTLKTLSALIPVNPQALKAVKGVEALRLALSLGFGGF